MTSKQIVLNLDKILNQAKVIACGGDMGEGITAVYYVGATLCIDLNYGTGSFEDIKHRVGQFLVMVNISGESFCVQGNEITGDEYENLHLLTIAQTRLAFDIYYKSKGANDFFMECYKKSCLRHFDYDQIEGYKYTKNKPLDTFTSFINICFAMRLDCEALRASGRFSSVRDNVMQQVELYKKVNKNHTTAHAFVYLPSVKSYDELVERFACVTKSDIVEFKRYCEISDFEIKWFNNAVKEIDAKLSVDKIKEEKVSV